MSHLVVPAISLTVKSLSLMFYYQFVGPIYSKEEADKLGLPVKPDGDHFRRVVPSPLPLKLVGSEMRALKLLTDAGCVVVCAGGGGKLLLNGEIIHQDFLQ